VTDISDSLGEGIDFRALLEAEQRTLLEKLSGSGRAGVNTVGHATPDSNQVASWRGEAKSPTLQAQENLAQVESALRRLDDGTYGICERCSGNIAPERLEALPATPRCVQCV
jgi:DnaK suppressor protein